MASARIISAGLRPVDALGLLVLVGPDLGGRVAVVARVARVAAPVTVAVGLAGVDGPRAEVHRVPDLVAVVVGVARVTEPVAVDVNLRRVLLVEHDVGRVGHGQAVVEGVRDAVAVAVGRLPVQHRHRVGDEAGVEAAQDVEIAVPVPVGDVGDVVDQPVQRQRARAASWSRRC